METGRRPEKKGRGSARAARERKKGGGRHVTPTQKAQGEVPDRGRGKGPRRHNCEVIRERGKEGEKSGVTSPGSSSQTKQDVNKGDEDFITGFRPTLKRGGKRGKNLLSPRRQGKEKSKPKSTSHERKQPLPSARRKKRSHPSTKKGGETFPYDLNEKGGRKSRPPSLWRKEEGMKTKLCF